MAVVVLHKSVEDDFAVFLEIPLEFLDRLPLDDGEVELHHHVLAAPVRGVVVDPRPREEAVESVLRVDVIVVSQRAQEEALAEAAGAQENLVVEFLQALDEAGAVNEIAVTFAKVREVAHAVWDGLDSLCHSAVLLLLVGHCPCCHAP